MTSGEKISKKGQLGPWLERQGLGRHVDKLTDVNGDIGLVTLEDLEYLSDQDVESIADTCGMNLIEKKRFLRVAQALRNPNAHTTSVFNVESLKESAEESPAADKAMVPAELDMAIEKEAADMDQFVVVPNYVHIRKGPSSTAMSIGILNQGHILHVHKERVLGVEGQVWAEVTALELQRSRDSGAQAARGFVLIDGHKSGDGLQLRPHSGSAPTEATSEGNAEFRAALEAFEHVPDSANLYEVVKSVVFVNKFPDMEARSLGTLKKGRVIQVKQELVHSSDGREWAELTNLEMWRSCEPDDAGDRGFVLIRDLVLGSLLHGPLSRDPKTWLASSHTHKHRMDPTKMNAAFAATTFSTVKPVAFNGIETYAHLWEVAKKMVYVKASPNKDAKTIGCLKEGHIIQAFQNPVYDTDGHSWVELTNYELWHSCRPESTMDQGFALIDGAHLGIGVLLKGPLSKALRQEWQKNQLEEFRKSANQKLAEEASREHDAQDIQKRMTEPSWKTATYVYRALRDNVFIKWSGDPRYEWITESSCRPGTAFYTTGMEWRGPNGEHWVDGVEVDGKPRWLLTEDPLTLGRPYLIEDKFAEDHIHVRVNYTTALGPKAFRAYLDANATGRALKERFSRDVNIRAELISIMVKASEPFSEPTELKAAETLEQQRISSNSQLFVRWDDDLYQSISIGHDCGWL